MITKPDAVPSAKFIEAANALADAVETYNAQKLLWKPAPWSPVAEALSAYRAAMTAKPCAVPTPADERVCRCDLRTKTLGDGCDVCNPLLALEHARETIAELRQQLRAIGDKAHDLSTGPAVQDGYWEIREMAYGN